MKIEWNKVTRLSQILAVVLFLVVFCAGLLVGRKYENTLIVGKPINSVRFVCAEGKAIDADFYGSFVHISTDSIKNLYLPQTISASGARYANKDDSIVFWNKGDTAFISVYDPDNIVYRDCVITK